MRPLHFGGCSGSGHGGDGGGGSSGSIGGGREISWDDPLLEESSIFPFIEKS